MPSLSDQKLMVARIDQVLPLRSHFMLLLGRVAIASLFLWSGWGKLAASAAQAQYMASHGIPAADILVYAAALFEIGAGALLIIGYMTRWAAIGLIAYTVLASVIFHAFWTVPTDQVVMQQINFMKNVAIVGGLLLIAAGGAGRYALR